MQAISLDSPHPRDDNYRQLEAGNILVFPQSPFSVPEADVELLRTASVTGGSRHKNIAYKPGKDALTGVDGSENRARLHAVMRSYSEGALNFLRAFLPRYMAECHIDYASFRPEEEEGRALPLNKRNDLLHVDAFPSRPTRGDLILRCFTNVNASKGRVWITSDPLAALAPRLALRAGLSNYSNASASSLGRFARRIGVPLKDRSAYDRFMLHFHDYLKGNEGYQRETPKYRFEFPPGSTWLVFTDLVPHAVMSGQYALEQTVIVRRDALLSRAAAPISILESLAGWKLA